MELWEEISKVACKKDLKLFEGVWGKTLVEPLSGAWSAGAGAGPRSLSCSRITGSSRSLVSSASWSWPVELETKVKRRFAKFLQSLRRSLLATRAFSSNLTKQ